MLIFYVGAGESELGLHTSALGTLPTEPSQSLMNFSFRSLLETGNTVSMWLLEITHPVSTWHCNTGLSLKIEPNTMCLWKSTTAPDLLDFSSDILLEGFNFKKRQQQLEESIDGCPWRGLPSWSPDGGKGLVYRKQ